MKPYLERMFRFVFWADRRILAALREAPAAKTEAMPLQAHILAAEHVWLSRLQNREPRHVVWPMLSADECDQLLVENEAGYLAFFANFTDEQLTELRQYRNAAGQEFATPVIDILLQVSTHGGYHRGQIAKIIARYGSTPPGTDFIVFAREGN